MPLNSFLPANFGKLVFSLTVLLFAYAMQVAVRKTLRIAFTKFKTRINQEHFSRTNTVRLLLVNIINFTIFLIAVLTVLSAWGVDVRPVLAGIGIFGIALSFGSQSLVKDFIGGFFIIIEDQFRVGDTIKVGTVEGEVRKITIRSTVVKDKDGNRIYIPNSKIDIVTRVKPKTQLKKRKK